MTKKKRKRKKMAKKKNNMKRNINLSVCNNNNLSGSLFRNNAKKPRIKWNYKICCFFA